MPKVRAIWVRPVGRKLNRMDSLELPSEYQKFKALFEEREGLAALPEHKPWDHKIEFQEGKVPDYKGWLRELSKQESDFLREYTKNLEAKGFIRRNDDPRISHGVLFANKKDGGLRPCIDFRLLNQITKKNVYPLPLIQELQNRLGKAKWFC